MEWAARFRAARTARRASPALKPLANSVAAQLVALVLAVALPLTGVMALVWNKAVQESDAAATELLRRSVASVTVQLRRDLRQAASLLAQLAEEPAVAALDPRACVEEWRLLRALHPEYLNLMLWRADGRAVCSADAPASSAPPPAQWRKAFERTLAGEGLHVSDVFFGRKARQHVVVFSYPIAAPGQPPKGVLSAAVSLKHFDALLREVEMPPGSALAITDRAGQFVARAPEGERWHGRRADALTAAAVPELAARDVARLGDGADGRERLYVTEAVPAAGWRVYGGIPQALLLAQQREWLLWAIAVALAALVVSGAAAYLIATRVARAFERTLGAEKALTTRLLRAEEQERLRISRELHDQIGQDLTALNLELARLRSPELEGAAAIARRLIDQVRDVTLALRPPLLDDLGLVAALRSHLDEQVARHGIRVHFHAELGAARIPREVEVACFRLAQEALTNVLRYAAARNVWVAVATANGELVLTVRDDGAGFDVAAALREAASGRSLGLRNLYDRAELLRGSLDIRSAPGRGTEVQARIPL